ncbi:MAG: alpha-ketoacid dehydrogenase subunit beta [Methyloligellaceae bacterium]
MIFSDAIKDALDQSMVMDSKVLCYGLGVTDPKRIFSTTQGLLEKFGNDRVFDMPISENAMTGVGIGLAVGGYRPVFMHQRLDFYLLAMDQLVNGAAKWHMMFGGAMSVPLTIRLIIGRGWGQGPTHSQSLQAWFAHIPGLKVVMPSNPADAKGLLMSSIFDNDPVVFLEHRWLHAMEGEVPQGDYRVPIGKANLVRQGSDITVVANSLMVPEAIHALDALKEKGVTADLIDLRTIRPIDWTAIQTSVNKTGRLLALDHGVETGSIAGEIIAHISSRTGSDMRCNPQRICMPDYAVPTTTSLTEHMYPGAQNIATKIADMLEVQIHENEFDALKRTPHDVPGNWFKGPF